MKKTFNSEIPMMNFNHSGILKSVDVKKKKFKLGNLTFKLPKSKELSLAFIENYCHLEITDELENSINELVNIRFVDEGVLHGFVKFKDFVGIELQSHTGIVLRAGYEFNEGSFKQIFEYQPHFITSLYNNIDIASEIIKN